MPKVSSVHHIGIPVSDLERSLKWYEDVLGIVANGVTVSATNPALGAVLEVDNPSLRAAFALADDNVLLELIHYDRPEPKSFEGRNCDVGMIHLCFEVDDIEMAHRELKARGVHINADPVVLESGEGINAGALAGVKVVYLRDPDGIQLELIELPK
jgi:catechol 2,3-dioxygenase-like lactoylglutathione lyase family enzyme